MKAEISLLLVIILLAICNGTYAAESRFTLWQLPEQTPSQMMSYVMQTVSGKLIVIDGGTSGDAAYLSQFIKDKGNKVDMWFITHPHSDHIDALTAILNNPQGIKIERIYASLPDVEWLERVEPPYVDSLRAFNAAQMKSSHYINLVRGAVFTLDGIRIEILGIKNPELTTGLNDSSVVLKISDPVRSVLFLGDIGVDGGEKLLEYAGAKKLKSDYIQMAHHGQGAVNEDFYKVINPSVCLWTTPKWLWDNDSGNGKGSGPWQTLEVRAWMDKLSIKRNYVTGVDGLTCIE